MSSKKTQKLGAKKVVSADAIDFEEAERKAKEEAERIEKLGYDPEAEQAELEAKEKAAATTTIASPTPISPARGGFGATGKAPEKSAAEMERLGMGMSRLGFGQVSKPVVAKKPGFGAVAPAQRSAADGMIYPICTLVLVDTNKHTEEEIEQNRSRFGAQKGISSDEFFGREQFDPSAQAEAKTRLNNFEGATSISSNAYFGRPEEDYPNIDDGYGDLENAAKDFVRRFGITAGDDLENLTQVLGEGATKLQGRFLSNSTCHLY